MPHSIFFWGDQHQSHSIGISEVFTKRDGISGVPMAGVDELHGYPGGFGACIASKSYRGGDVGGCDLGRRPWIAGHGMPWMKMEESTMFCCRIHKMCHEI